MCFTFAPASEWKVDIEWIAHHTHSDVKQYSALLICDCSNKRALRKRKQPLSKDRMFLTCYKKECNFFYVERPANIAWYQEAAFAFASATSRKIPSLCRDEGDV